jgi:hypothetical protein
MVYKTVREAFRSKTFAGQMIMTAIINFGVNFGFEWASMSEWGARKNTAAWPALTMWTLDADINSCIGMDLLITAFMIGFMCMLLATGGTQKEVREKKCEVLDPTATAKGFWSYTPVRHRNLCFRSLMSGIYLTVFFGVPTVLIVWAAVGSGTMPGLDYTVFKGLWAAPVACAIYCCVFLAAIDKRNFPEIEFEALMEQAAAKRDDGSAPPLVAQVAHI